MGINKGLHAPLAVMFLIFMAVIAIFSFGFAHADGELRTSIHNSCTARNVNRAKTNAVLTELITAANKSDAFGGPEKIERIAGWAALRSELEECTR